MSILLPNATLSLGAHWSPNTFADPYTLLDEGNAHNGGTDTVSCTNSGSLGGALGIGFDVPSILVNELTLRLYSTTNGGDVTATLFINGSAYGTVDDVIAPDSGGSGGWTQLVFTGSWNVGDITSLSVEFKLTNSFSSCILDSTYIAAVYNSSILFTFGAESRGVARLINSRSRSDHGVGAIYNARSRDDRGVTRCGYGTYLRSELGLTVFGKAFVSASAGASASYQSWQSRSIGISRASYSAFARVSVGSARITNAFSAASRGIHRVSYLSFQQDSIGRAQWNNRFIVESRGVYALMNQFGNRGVGVTRIANEALARYEIYRGVNGAVDFSAAWQTLSGSSFTLPSLTAGKSYRFVVRKRNAYGLVSENIDEYRLELDGSGNVTATRPGAPRDVRIEQIAGPKIRITAKYDYQLDGVAEADKWVVWAKVNSTINPAIDAPISTASMRKADGSAKLNVTAPLAGNYSGGDVVHVLVRCRRSGSPNIDSSNTAETTATITLSIPGTPSGGIFIGSEFEQRQVS